MVQIKYCIVLLLAVDVILALQENTTANSLNDVEIKKKKIKDTRRKDRSTSSSSRSKEDGGRSKSSNSRDSLDMKSLSSSSESGDQSGKKKRPADKKYQPESSFERKGWKKWHRKCTPCFEDMAKKWRDPGIKWICGAYQRAQRSFKSLCMMHYRNCQDGTMFTKIHDHRCVEDKERAGKPHGEHFFYDYKVAITGETSKSESESESSSVVGSADEDLFNDGDYFVEL